MTSEGEKTIVVLGGGFGGLTFCRSVRSRKARVILVDRQNHHLFQPLLYQVATAGLAMPEIAEPLRSILTNRREARVRMAEVKRLDLRKREVVLEHDEKLAYDFLVIALGAVTHYLGHPEWGRHAFGLKTLHDALRIRTRLLDAFERAESESDPVRRRKLTTVVVIGGGPTGVEMAGALAELTKRVFARDYRNVAPGDVRIYLVEAGETLLGQYRSRLREKAGLALQDLGVEVLLSSPVQEIGPGLVRMPDTEIHAETIVWTAGVEANPLTRTLDADLDKRGRVKVKHDLSVPGHPEVFVLGDAAMVHDPDGTEVPGVAPAAIQAAKHAAHLIDRELEGQGGARAGDREAFRYRDRGKMCTIGRSIAVAEFSGFSINGLMAWLLWLVVHLLSLIGFRNKLAVLIQWFAAYVRFRPGARILARKVESDEQDG